MDISQVTTKRITITGPSSEKTKAFSYIAHNNFKLISLGPKSEDFKEYQMVAEHTEVLEFKA